VELVMRVYLGLALLPACLPQIGFDGTRYDCPDGVSCPSGFTCVEAVCLDEVPPEEPVVDADLPPDAPIVPPGAPPGPTVEVPASRHDQGCLRLIDDGCPEDATPRHDVELSAFRIDAHEVTQAEYQACVLAGACAAPRDRFDPLGRADFPVTDVSWDDALAYCRFAGKRLPSEAEWEHAARGPDEFDHPWGDEPPDCARATFAGCADAPLAVGSHVDDASAFGATELAGNVAEWVADYYAADYYGDAPEDDPPGPDAGDERVLRGGGFTSTDVELRSWQRGHAPPVYTAADLGFRCAS
jgi:formylglycine-generating enzyme required for sulfatase activity